jgi:hypothetical protein
MQHLTALEDCIMHVPMARLQNATPPIERVRFKKWGTGYAGGAMSAIPRGSRQRCSCKRFFSHLSLKVVADGSASAVRLPFRTGFEGRVVVLGGKSIRDRQRKEAKGISICGFG